MLYNCVEPVSGTHNRVYHRNAFMTQFTGLPAKAVVIGTEIPSAIADIAEREAVHCIAITNKGARPR